MKLFDLKRLLSSIFCSLLFASCTFGPYQLSFADDTVDDRVKSVTNFTDKTGYLPNEGTDWTTLTGSTYSFLIVCDMHIGAGRYSHDDAAFYKWFEKACRVADETKKPRFIINLGDIADTGAESQFSEYVDEWCVKVQSIAAETGVVADAADFKIYNIVGNHDIYNDGQKYFKDMIWPHNYSYYFDFAGNSANSGFGYYFFDTGNGSFGKYQYESMQKVMAKDPRPKLVFTHYPVYADSPFVMVIEDTLERAKILTLFAETNVKMIQAGHVHYVKKANYGDFFEEVSDSYADRNGARLVTVDEAAGSVTTEGVNF